jgi:hypothetical protein
MQLDWRRTVPATAGCFNAVEGVWQAVEKGVWNFGGVLNHRQMLDAREFQTPFSTRSLRRASGDGALHDDRAHRAPLRVAVKRVGGQLLSTPSRG